MSPQLGTHDAADLESGTGHRPAGPVDFGVVLGQVFAGEPPIGRGGGRRSISGRTAGVAGVCRSSW